MKKLQWLFAALFLVKNLCLLNAANDSIVYFSYQYSNNYWEEGTGTPVFLGNNELSGELPIGFSFNFFGKDYINFYISSNGYITFTSNNVDSCCSGQLLPDTTSPNNLIAFAWGDLHPEWEGVIEYFTKGLYPNRMLVVNFKSIPGPGFDVYWNYINTQLVLYESNNIITIHTNQLDAGNGNFTMGIENEDGTKAYFINGRNASNWSVWGEQVSFYQSILNENDAGIEDCNLLQPFCYGDKPIIATVRNFGRNTIDSVTINWEFDGVLQTPVVYKSTLTPYTDSACSAEVTLGTRVFEKNVTHTISIWTSLPNGKADTETDNDKISFTARPVMGGIYTIGGTQPDFATFSSALSRLSQQGVGGNVIFKVRDGIYNEQLTIYNISGTSDSATVTFESESGDSNSVILTYNSTSSYYNYVVKLYGCSYINFNKITLQAKNTTYGRIIHFYYNAHNNVFSNCVLQGVKSSGNVENLSVIYSENSYYYYNNYNQFKNNKILNGTDGIYLAGKDYYAYDKGIVIENNNFINQYNAALYAYEPENITITGNIINSNSSYSDFTGITISSAKVKFNISNNQIYLSNGKRGIYINNCDINGLVSNNFILLNGSNYCYGIYLYSSSYTKIYNNTIHILNNYLYTYAIMLYESYYVEIMNNIMANNGGGYALYYYSTGGLVSDYNDMYTTGNILVEQYGGGYNTLKDFQAATGLDMHSYSVDPIFTSSNSYKVNEFFLNGTAAVLGDVLKDINGDLRDLSNPDIGADEFIPLSPNASLINFENPTVPFNNGLSNIIVGLCNCSPENLTSVDIDWEINGVRLTKYNWTGNLVAGDTVMVQLGTYNFITDSVYSFKAWTSLPNGNNDINKSNDTIEVSYLSSGLKGEYTIGGFDGDFPDFQSAVDALKQRGITGNVIFKARNGTYIEQLDIPEIIGASDTSTITFESESSDSSLVILNFPSSEAKNYTIKLNGANYIRFNKITIQSSNSNYSNVVSMINDASNNKFSNCVLKGMINSGYIIYSSYSNDNFNSFVNNKIINGQYGINLTGRAYDNTAKGLLIENNLFENQYYRAIFIAYLDSISVTGNTVNPNSTISYFYNTYCQNCGGITISSNKFYAPNSGYGIELYGNSATASTNNLISNNFIYIGGTSTAYGIYIYSFNNLKVFNNTINISNSNIDNSYCLYNYYGQNITLKNNIFANTGDGRAIYNANAQYITYSDYNDFYTNGTRFVYWAGEQANLTSLQSISGKDLHSCSLNPMFTSPMGYNVSEIWLQGNGIPVEEVIYDIDGNPRDSAGYDIGAANVVPVSLDAGLVSVTWPKKPFNPGNNDIIVKLKNCGKDTLKTIGIDWVVNEVLQTRYNWTGNLAPSDTVNVKTGTIEFTPDTSYIIKAWTTMPNGLSDVVNLNDTVISAKLYTSMEGVYTIGGENPDFSTLQQAVSALENRGITGNVIFKFRPGTYTEQVSIPEITGAKAGSTITFEPESADTNDVIITYSSTSNNYTIQLNGTDYVNFNRLIIRATGTISTVFDIRNGANYNTLSSCTIEGMPDGNALIYSYEYSNDNFNTFINNNFIDGSNGLSLYGSNISGIEKGTVIENNILTNQTSRAISAYYQDSLIIRGNSIFTNSSYYDYASIYCNRCNNSMLISGNKLISPTGRYGICLYSCTATDMLYSNISNNFIRVGETNAAYGIYVYYCSYQNFINNSILNTCPNVSNGIGLYCYNGSHNVLMNNIIANTGGGGYTLYCYPGTNIDTCDYNDLYTTGGNLAYWAGARTTLAALQSASNNDLHSIVYNPLFVSDTNLHIQEVWLKGAGVSVEVVSTDIDGEARNITNPDIGADEMNLPQTDAGLNIIKGLKMPLLSATNDIIVELKNFSSNTLSSVSIDWAINNIQQARYNWSGTLPSGDTTYVKLGTYILPVDSSTSIKAWTTLPNGLSDAFNYNDTIYSAYLYTPLAGTYTIGGDTSDYKSFNEALFALSFRGVMGDVVFKVKDSIYNEQIIINEISGASATSTIKFETDSDTSKAILTFSATYSNNFTIKLNGADYLTFNKLNIQATNSSYARVFDIGNGSNHNTISNCTLQGLANSSQIIYSQGTVDEFNTFTGNTIINGSTGIYLAGVSSTGFEKGTIIEKNIFENQSANAIQLLYQDSALISDNIINASPSSSNYSGINGTYWKNKQVISGNKITISIGGTGISLNYCNGLSGSSGLISNNFIITGGNTNSYGILLTGTEYFKIYNNNILISANQVGSYQNSGINIISNCHVIDIKNNILANIGGGQTIIAYKQNLNSSDYNDLFTTGNVLAYLSGDWENLSELQAKVGLDLHSCSINPVFISDTDLHIYETALKGKGTPLPEISVDIDGEARNSINPDLGADEFTLPVTDAGIFGSENFDMPLHSGINDIYAIIKNYGSDILNSVTIAWEVDSVQQSAYNWTGNLASGDTARVNIGTYQFNQNKKHYAKLWTSLPNGISDVVNYNDTLIKENMFNPLNGTYTIGGENCDFLNFTDAVSTLLAAGISDSVIFKVRDGVYEEQVCINDVIGATDTSAIVFEPEDIDSGIVELTYSGSESDKYYTVRLNGAKYVNFNKINISAADGSYGKVIEIGNGSSYNTFSNCLLQGNTYSSMIIDAQGGNKGYNSFKNNQIMNGIFGIYYLGDQDSLEEGIVIENNVFNSQINYPIMLGYLNAPVITKNQITPNSGYDDIIAVLCSNCSNNMVISKNYIYMISGGNGIYLENCNGTEFAKGIISNNLIYNHGLYSTSLNGIYLSNSTYQNVYYNTIRMGTSNYVTPSALYCDFGVENINVKNNILMNYYAGYPIYLASSTSISSSDYNDLYTRTGGIIAHWGTDMATLADLRAATNMDLHSVTIAPTFKASNNLHTTQLLLNGTGTPLAEVSEDYDGETRDAVNPDIGADEIFPPEADAGVTLLISPKKPFPSGNNNINIILRNYGADTLKSVTIEWNLNDVLQPSYNWIGSLTSGKIDTVTIATYDFIPDSAYNLTFWSSLPNGSVDTINTNDTLKLTGLYAALSGEYTIGGINPDFYTFQEAADALYLSGVCGKVVFKIRDGSYYEQVVISSITGASDSTNVVFEPETQVDPNVVLTYNYNTLTLDGSHYISFRKMTLVATGPDYGNIVTFDNATHNISFDSVTFIGVSNYNSSANFALVYCNGCNNQYNKFEHCHFEYGSYGLYYYSDLYPKGTIINNNYFLDQYMGGIYLDNQDAPQISGNYFSTNLYNSNYYGIKLLNCLNNLLVNKNRIELPIGYGIDISDCYSIGQQSGTISNNFISVGGDSYSVGLYLTSRNNQNIYFNTINITNTSASSTSLYIDYGGKYNIIDNIFANNIGYAVTTYDVSCIESMDYNCLYTGGTYLTNCLNINGNTLNDWMVTSGLDSHSISVLPLFISNTDLHVKEVALKNRGIPISGITGDIDGDLRNGINPDIGADEFQADADDAGVLAITSPALPFATGNNNITTLIKNFGTDTLKSVSINWSVNNVIQLPMAWSGIIPAASTSEIVIGQYNFEPKINYSIKIWTTSPNNNADTTNANDTVLVSNIYPSLNGTYTIGGTSPDFTTINDAVDALVKGGAGGKVIFNIRPGIYNEQVSIPQILGTSAVNTITFKPENNDSTSVIVSYYADYALNFTLLLDGVDYLIFEKLTFESTNPDYNRVITLQNSSNYNIFKGNIISSPLDCYSYSNISSGNSSNDNYNLFENNIIENGEAGIVMAGISLDNPEKGTIIKNNRFINTYGKAVQVSNQDNYKVDKNYIVSNILNTAYRGIWAENTTNMSSIMGNKIINNGGGYGLYVNNCRRNSGFSVIANNFISTGGTSTANGLYVYNSSNIYICFNNINITSPASGTMALSLFYASNLYLNNNISTNNGGGYAIYLSNPQGGVSSDYNDLFTTGTNLGYYNGNNQAGLLNWSSATGMDINSYNEDPLYTSAIDLHIHQVTLKNAGIPVSSVFYDIDAELRNTSFPDIGADEFVFYNNDIGIKTIVSPVTGCKQGFSTVTLAISNSGSKSQTGFDVTYIVDGYAPVTENVGTLNIGPGETQNYSFYQLIDNSDLDNYSIKAFTSLANDEFRINDSITRTVINYPIPGPVSNMLPENASDGISNPVTFSWTPGQDATKYDLYIWQSGTNRPANPVLSNYTQVSYTHYTNLDYSTTYNWQIISKSDYCSSEGMIQSFTIRELPDLIVNSVQIPVSVYSGQNAAINWEIKNSGNGSTSQQQWVDVVYLSTDASLETNVDIYLGGVGNLAALNPGESYLQTANFIIPNGLNGNYYVFVVTNMYNSLPELSNSNNSGNNAFVINLTPPPDLKVTSIITPGTVFSGQEINVIWTVSNTGSGETMGSYWCDRIYISEDTVFSGNGYFLGEKWHSGELAAEESYDQTQAVFIPNNLLGMYYIYIYSDIYNNIYEHANENNNFRQSDSIKIILTPPPDLLVSEIVVPYNVSCQEQITIQWTVENNGGTATPQNGWTDRVYITKNADYDLNTSIDSFDVNHSGILDITELYTEEVIYSMTGADTGLFYIYISNDIYKQVFEYLNENNNTLRCSQPILVSSPDISVTDISMPLGASSGQDIIVGLKVNNTGQGSVLTKWSDKIMISNSPVYVPEQMVNAKIIERSDIINANSSIDYNDTITLPEGYYGNYYVFIQSDYYNEQFEENEDNNLVRSESTIYITLSPSPDLQITTSDVPDTMTAGQYIGITLTVANKGVGPTKKLTWSDAVYFSPDSILTPESPQSLLNTITNQYILAIDSSYSITSSIQIPNYWPQGVYYIHSYCDIYNQVFENADENNNFTRSNPIFLYSYPPVDLAVINVKAPISTGSGMDINVDYTVKNIGNAQTFSDFCYDAIYLSSDSILSQYDILLKEWVYGKTIDAGKSINISQTVRIPDGMQGNYYLIVQTDKYDNNNDDDRENNNGVLRNSSGIATPIEISLTPYPDLSVTSFITPPSGISGQPVKVKWSVINNGTGSTLNGSWNDRIYLSTDMVPGDYGDIILGTFIHNSVLDEGGSYTDSMEVTLPSNISGNFIIIVQVDNNNVEYEHRAENNNTGTSALLVKLPPPCDLIISDISMPDSALTGSEITVSWIIENIGTNPASGYLKDMGYLSKDEIWDLNDIVLSPVYYNINIAPMGQTIQSITVELPGAPVGNYYIIVRTDILDNIYEADNANNISYSSSKLNITVKNLPLNITIPDILVNNKALYYKIEISEELAGEALLVILKGDSVNGNNEFYIRYNEMPTRVIYGYAHDNPYQGNQEIIIPTLTKGTYYIMIYGNTTGNNEQQVELFARKLDFDLRSITANKGGNNGKITVLLQGAKFEPDMMVYLTLLNDSIRAEKVDFVDNVKVFATFNLSSKAPGIYNVFIKKLNNESDELAGGFEIVKGIKPDFQLYVRYPSSIGPGTATCLSIEYSNAGNIDIEVPNIKLKSISSAPVAFTYDGLKDKQKELYLKCSEINGPPDVLRPSAKGTIIVYTKAVTLLGFTIEIPDLEKK